MMVESIGPVRTVKAEIHKANSAKVAAYHAPLPLSKPKQKAESEIKIPESLLNEVEHEIQMMRNVGIQFSVHEPTGRTIIRVVDKETEDLIREIPPEEFLDLVAKLDEMIGILFDRKV
jgi:flagellar protein FlaG